MIKTTPDQLIIIIDHQDPRAVLDMLQKGIIQSLQAHFKICQEGVPPDRDQQQACSVLLEILKATLDRFPEM